VHVVFNRLEVPADHAEAFEQHFGGSMTGTLGAVPGLKRATLLRPNREGLPYIATMEFETEADFFAWMKSDAFRAAHGHGPGAAAESGADADAGAGEGRERPAVESYTLVTEVSRA
jgi:heme-degrading monooxygenase HmoA